jgi:hypothetical protein
MKKLIIGVMACYALTTRAQVQESKNFIYFFSDSVMHAENIRLRPDFSGYMQLRADAKRVPVGQVKFFNNEDGFFANTRKLDFAGRTSFSERIIAGKINVYLQESYDPQVYGRRYRQNRYMERGQPPVNVRMYYNKGYGDLKKTNYHNLNIDMADNMKSIDLLKSYRKNINTVKVMYIAAGASFLTGMLSFFNSGSTHMDRSSGFDSDFTRIRPVAGILMGAGVGFAIGGYAIQASGNRHLENAIDQYNR